MFLFVVLPGQVLYSAIFFLMHGTALPFFIFIILEIIKNTIRIMPKQI